MKVDSKQNSSVVLVRGGRETKSNLHTLATRRPEVALHGRLDGMRHATS